MKFCVGLLILFLYCQLGAQRFMEEIEVKDFLNIQSNVSTINNLDIITNKPLDPFKAVDFTLSPRPIRLDSVTPFISISAAWYEISGKQENTTISIRFSTNGSAWDSWIEFRPDDHYEKGRYTQASQLIYIDKKQKYYQLSVTSKLLHEGFNVHNIVLNFYNPGPALKSCSVPFHDLALRRNNSASCGCFKPNYISWSEWNCAQAAPPSFKSEVTHIILHHSGGLSISEDWNATVLSLWNAHTATFGYIDIGYDWLITPEGTIYEGRNFNGADAVGNHFCNSDDHTIGICLLGDYGDRRLTGKAMNALLQLLSWKACEWNIDPEDKALLGSSGPLLDRIAGHRDGCISACPGDSLYDQLPSIRLALKQALSQPCVSTAFNPDSRVFRYTCFPNPSRDFLVIQGNALNQLPIIYQILSPGGPILFTKSILAQGQFMEQVSSWARYPPGIYLLRLRSGEYVFHQKIIKY